MKPKTPGLSQRHFFDDEVVQTLAAGTNRRLGLLGMRERVEMVGGALTIESAPGQGTMVRAEIPFSPGGAA